jgi:mannose/fructose-specific phosphotransferase system component IIA
MTSIILVCHAPLGQALHAVACHAFGRYVAEVTVADISANASLDEAVATIETIWMAEGRPGEVMLLADLLGATPSNAASAWLGLHHDIKACGLTGVSVPMMLKAFTYRELAVDKLAEKLSDCVAPSCAAITAAA